MGCLCVKSDKARNLEEGESVIQQYEAALGFAKLPVDVSVSALEETSRKGALTRDLLRTWLAKLGISSVRLDTDSDSVTCLYAHFLERGRYSCRKLGVLAVLLSESSLQRKAVALYRVYSRLTGDLSSVDIENLVATCCELALIQLPKLAERETLTLRDLDTLRKLQKYTEKFSRFLEKIKSSLSKCLQVLAFNRATEEKFVEVVVEKAAVLLSSQTLRAHACTIIPELARQQGSSQEPASAELLARSRTRGNTLKMLKHTKTTMGLSSQQSRTQSYG